MLAFLSRVFPLVAGFPLIFLLRGAILRFLPGQET